jgi:predicted GNAT family N-acyltransferase
MLLIKEIPSKDTVAIRSEILRPGQELSNCIYPMDDDIDSFHLGVFLRDKQIGIVSFYKEIHPDLEGKMQFRFRGMAVLNEFRGKGYATSLLMFAFNKVKDLQGELVWCNARSNATRLYEKLNMKICSEEFDIPGIGPHFLMKKAIS